MSVCSAPHRKTTSPPTCKTSSTFSSAIAPPPPSPRPTGATSKPTFGASISSITASSVGAIPDPPTPISESLSHPKKPSNSTPVSPVSRPISATTCCKTFSCAAPAPTCSATTTPISTFPKWSAPKVCTIGSAPASLASLPTPSDSSVHESVHFSRPKIRQAPNLLLPTSTPLVA